MPVYQKIPDGTVSELERGVRPRLKPWSAGNTEGRIVRPRRANGIPCQGINVLMLRSQAMEQGFVSPCRMTFKQALALNAAVRKGEHGGLVVYADRIRRTESDGETGAAASENRLSHLI